MLGDPYALVETMWFTGKTTTSCFSSYSQRFHLILSSQLSAGELFYYPVLKKNMMHDWKPPYIQVDYRVWNGVTKHLR
jgi:hypothetical protein